MLFIVSSVLLSVQYLHSMSCKLLLPLYVASFTSCPFEFYLYPKALMMSSLWCCGLLCFASMFSGIMVGCFFVSLSFCRPSCVACGACSVWSFCGSVVSSFACALKCYSGLFPRSILRIGHLPPLCVPRRSCRSLNVILCQYVRSLALYLHPPRGVCLWAVCCTFYKATVPERYVASCICKRVTPKLLNRNSFCICTWLVSTRVWWSQCPCLSPPGVVFQRCLSFCCPCWLW